MKIDQLKFIFLSLRSTGPSALKKCNNYISLLRVKQKRPSVRVNPFEVVALNFRLQLYYVGQLRPRCGYSNREAYICQAELDKRFKLGLLRPKIFERNTGVRFSTNQNFLSRGISVVVVSILAKICRQVGKTGMAGMSSSSQKPKLPIGSTLWFLTCMVVNTFNYEKFFGIIVCGSVAAKGENRRRATFIYIARFLLFHVV